MDIRASEGEHPMIRRVFMGAGAVLLAILVAATAGQDAFAAKKVKIGLFPFGAGRMVDQYILDNGIHKKWGAKIGVEFEISHPRDDFAAFMGKSVNIVALSTMEVARVVADEGYDLTMYGRQVDAFTTMYVRKDSAYKGPGDLKGKKIVHPGWDTGSAQMGSILLKEWYGIDMKKDFRVVTAPWPVGPQLLAKGDVEMSINLVPLTMKLEMDGKIRPLFPGYAKEWAKRRGTGHHLTITNFTSWGKWLNNNEEAARAWLGLYSEGMKYAHENTLEWAKTYRNFITKNATDAQVKWFAGWLKDTGVVYQNAYIDQKFVEEENAFLRLGIKAGVLKPSVINSKIWRTLKAM
jgi:ABC-type nitrate/sulfonate/bicarbonate transport system substrate-binding protein